MRTPAFIRYGGRKYRLAADPAPETATDVIQETAGNPTDNPAPEKPEEQPTTTLSPNVAEGDLKTLELLSGNVVSKGVAFKDGMAGFMDSLKDRTKADQVLLNAKGNLDSLLEDFKLLSDKYKGYAKRYLAE